MKTKTPKESKMLELVRRWRREVYDQDRLAPDAGRSEAEALAVRLGLQRVPAGARVRARPEEGARE